MKNSEMFGLFKKKEDNYPRYEVYQSEIEKYQSIISRIQSSDEKFILIYHFANTKEELRKLLDAARIDSSKNSLDSKVVITSSDSFQSTNVSNSTIIIVTEIHPLPEPDKAVLKKSKTSSLTVNFYSAIDSPFFKIFGGERLVGIFKSLGMRDGETIKHPMVWKAISKTQEKNQERIDVEKPERESIEKWMEVNGLG